MSGDGAHGGNQDKSESASEAEGSGGREKTNHTRRASKKRGLAEERVAQSIDRPLALVGMMGVGKTTVGRRLAQRLDLPFFDVDEQIVEAAGMSVTELFERHGEESFRKGEAQVIERLLADKPVVLATGGGALTHPATRTLIAEKSLSVWLQAPIDLIVERATRRPTRPLLKKGDPRETLQRLLKERTPYYSAADITVTCKEGPHARTVDAIIDALDQYADTAHGATE